MKHTKEPWAVINTVEDYNWSSRIVSRVQTYGERISPDHPWKDEPMVVVDDWAVDEIDARRIVACVNACIGLTNEVLQNGIVADGVALVLNEGKQIGVDWDGGVPYYEGVPVFEE